MSRVRKGLGIGLGLVGLIFLGSVACPPLSERDSPLDPVRLELGDPIPERGPAEKVGRVFLSQSAPSSGSRTLPFFARVADATTGQAISTPTFLLGGKTRIRGLIADEEGIFSLPLVGDAPRPLQVQAVGFFPLEQPARPGEICPFLLKPATSVQGQVEIRPGQRASSGTMALERADSPGHPLLLPVGGPTGYFASPLLEPGIWILSYRKHPRDVSEQGPSAVLELLGGPPTQVLVQLHQGSSLGRTPFIQVQN